VNFDNHDDATRAVNALHGSKLGNKKIFIVVVLKRNLNVSTNSEKNGNNTRLASIKE